jgi:hypothetical protein
MGQKVQFGLNDRVLANNEDLLTTQIDDETVMMSIAKGKYYALDSTANHIWQHIQTPVKIVDLIKDLFSVYEGKPDEIEKDVLAFLTRLEKEGMIRFESAAA